MSIGQTLCYTRVLSRDVLKHLLNFRRRVSVLDVLWLLDGNLGESAPHFLDF